LLAPDCRLGCGVGGGGAGRDRHAGLGSVLRDRLGGTCIRREPGPRRVPRRAPVAAAPGAPGDGRFSLGPVASPGPHRLGPRDPALPGKRRTAREPAPRRPRRARLPPGAAAVLALPARLVGTRGQPPLAVPRQRRGDLGVRDGGGRRPPPEAAHLRLRPRNGRAAGRLARRGRPRPLGHARQRAVPRAGADAAGAAGHLQRRVASPLLPAAGVAGGPSVPRIPAGPGARPHRAGVGRMPGVQVHGVPGRGSSRSRVAGGARPAARVAPGPPRRSGSRARGGPPCRGLAVPELAHHRRPPLPAGHNPRRRGSGRPRPGRGAACSTTLGPRGSGALPRGCTTPRPIR